MDRKNIILTTLNSSYFHTAFGLRYLYANLGSYKLQTQLMEFTTQQNPRDIAEEILKTSPQIVGISVYIWNTAQTYELVSLLKRIAPHVCTVLGGPEVSYEYEESPLCQLADHVILGEGDLAFHSFIENFGNAQPKFLPSPLPDLSQIHFPYRYYSEEDIQNRVIYVEASRGCPYKCEFCLSSLDKSVRAFNTDGFLNEIQHLIDRGARSFKFVDRTFNLNYQTSQKILQFFLDRAHLGLFIHFELVPDRLPQELREIISQFPKGSLQFEVGIQTFNDNTATLVSRRQDLRKTEENLVFLKTQTGAHIHTDLIAGLPGENLQSFALGFDRLFALHPHEIQIGILKRLKGTPITRHDTTYEMVYQPAPPFPILRTKHLTFAEMQGIQRFAKFWDLYGNSGNFKRSIQLLVALTNERPDRSLFWEFWEFSEYLNIRHPQRHSISLLNLVESFYRYLVEIRGLSIDKVRPILINDYTGDIPRDIPSFLSDKKSALGRTKLRLSKRALPKRQTLHFGNY